MKGWYARILSVVVVSNWKRVWGELWARWGLLKQVTCLLPAAQPKIKTVLLCFLLGFCPEAVLCVICRLRRLSMRRKWQKPWGSAESLSIWCGTGQFEPLHWWGLALLPSVCAAGLLCQGATSPAPLQSAFHVEAKVKQQWNRCNSVVASTCFSILTTLLWEAFHSFTVLAGEWMYREVWQITKVTVNP